MIGCMPQLNLNLTSSFHNSYMMVDRSSAQGTSDDTAAWYTLVIKTWPAIADVSTWESANGRLACPATDASILGSWLHCIYPSNHMGGDDLLHLLAAQIGWATHVSSRLHCLLLHHGAIEAHVAMAAWQHNCLCRIVSADSANVVSNWYSG